MRGHRSGKACIAALALACAPLDGSAAQPSDAVNPAPTTADWAAVAQLPDWSGVWTPDVTRQIDEIKANPMPWNTAAAPQIAAMEAEERAGRPRLVLYGCFPHGMPSWMLIAHDTMEILFTPGRVTMLGEGDGNRLRRIYTDGRTHPDDPDLTFHGHSIGHWEGKVLVVDTIGILPQAPIAVSESVGLPNNGEMHIRERLSLAKPNELHDELEITAPKVLERPYRTTRIWYRLRKRASDIVEGVCQQGMHRADTDARGNAIFKPQKMDAYGSPVPDDK